MKQTLILNWCNKYNCPGGDCGLTCCTSDWKIALLDSEIEGYKQMQHPFREEVVFAIDEGRKAMKCKDGKCVLLDDNGYCKLVINCGENALSKTCSVFPWLEMDYGIIREAVVEIVCPLVAEFLFEEEQLYFTSGELDEAEDEAIEADAANTYLSLFCARNILMEIFSICPQKYIYGKSFILFKSIDKIIEIIKSNHLNSDNIKDALNVYCNENAISFIFDQCDTLGEKFDAKEKIMYQTLLELRDMSIIQAALTHVNIHKPYVMEYLEKYLGDEKAFCEALMKYVNYIKIEYPMLNENFLLYSMVCSFAVTDKEKFGHTFAGRVIELFVIQLCGMAILEKYGTIDKKEFAVVIAALDRVVSHDKKMYEILYNYYREKQQDNQVYFMTLLA